MAILPADNTGREVVIIGGGFGGLYTAKALRRAPVRVTLLDRRNFHLFQPLLYQVAIGGLSPGDIASPLRSVLKHQANTRVWLTEVVDLAPAERCVRLADGTVRYDTLVLATGAQTSYFGHDEWASTAPGLKSIEDALDIRRRVLLAFEHAEREATGQGRAAWLTFVIVGAGPTGVELAGAVAELAMHTLKREFRAIDPSEARIILVEGAPRVLPPFPPQLSAKAAAGLQRLGVVVRVQTQVVAVDAAGVTLRSGNHSEHISARTVMWAAGVQASPMGRVLADKTGARLDRQGRIMVEPDLTVAGHPEIFVIGDLAHCADDGGNPLPGLAPVAMQQARYVADAIQRRLVGKPVARFRYRDRGSLATIGRNVAVANFTHLQVNGFIAWLAWVFVHLMYLVEFENRVLVFIQWAWNYMTWNRGARLITGPAPQPGATIPVEACATNGASPALDDGAAGRPQASARR